MPTITTEVKACARCGNEHELTFSELARPIELQARGDGTFVLVITHWSSCPVTNEPVLMRFTGEDYAG